jgi:hypothetical protein
VATATAIPLEGESAWSHRGIPATVGRVLAEAKVRPHRVRGKPRTVNNLAIAALIVTCATGKEIADQSAAQRRHQRSHINRINTPPAP